MLFSLGIAAQADQPPRNLAPPRYFVGRGHGLRGTVLDETACRTWHLIDMARTAALFLILILIPGSMASMAAGEIDDRAANSTARSNRGRVVGTVVGAAGGFALGLFAGLNWFDDAVDSDRKVWTTAIAFAAAGGAAGYFIGRSVDSRRAAPRPPVRAVSNLPPVTMLKFRLEAAPRIATWPSVRTLFLSDPRAAGDASRRRPGAFGALASPHHPSAERLTRPQSEHLSEGRSVDRDVPGGF